MICYEPMLNVSDFGPNCLRSPHCLTLACASGKSQVRVHQFCRFFCLFLFFANFSQSWMFCLVKKGFVSPLYPVAQTWRNWETVVSCRQQPALTRNCCNSLNVAVGLLAASLAGFLLLFSSILRGHPVLSHVSVIAIFSLHAFIIFTVFHGLSNALENFGNPLVIHIFWKMRSCTYFVNSVAHRFSSWVFSRRCL